MPIFSTRQVIAVALALAPLACGGEDTSTPSRTPLAGEWSFDMHPWVSAVTEYSAEGNADQRVVHAVDARALPEGRAPTNAFNESLTWDPAMRSVRFDPIDGAPALPDTPLDAHGWGEATFTRAHVENVPTTHCLVRWTSDIEVDLESSRQGELTWELDATFDETTCADLHDELQRAMRDGTLTDPFWKALADEYVVNPAYASAPERVRLLYVLTMKASTASTI